MPQSFVLSQTYKEKSFAAYGINLPPIRALLPTNLPKISANENSGLITGISEKMSVQTLQSYISVKNGSLQVTDKNGAGKSGIVGTGDKVRILNSSGAVFREFTVVLYGDVNGDGEISIKDCSQMISTTEDFTNICSKC